MHTNFIKRAAIGTSPVTIPGVYYYIKNKVEKGKGETNIFKPFVIGSIVGFIPILGSAIVCSNMGKAIDNWSYDRPLFQGYSSRNRAQIAGGFSGILLQASIAPLLVNFFRKALHK